MNKRHWMLIGWLLITLVLSGLVVMPVAWAMPSQQGGWPTVPEPTPTSGPPTEAPPTQEPPTTQPPGDTPTATPSPEEPTATPTLESGTSTVTPTPSVTQTVTETPTAGETTPTVSPTMMETATPTAVSLREGTSTPDVSVTDALGEEVSDGASTSSEIARAEATMVSTMTEEQPARETSDQSESGNGSWLFFGGVGLLLVGVVLLLVWRRQG